MTCMAAGPDLTERLAELQYSIGELESKRDYVVRSPRYRLEVAEKARHQLIEMLALVESEITIYNNILNKGQ